MEWYYRDLTLTPGYGLGGGLNVDDDSEELNARMSDISDSTTLGDIVGDDSIDDSVGDSFEDSDSAEPMIDTEADFDAELRNSVKPEHEEVDEVKSLPTMETPNPNTEKVERAQTTSMRELTIFREMSHDIEDKVLNKHQIKLRKSGKRNHVPKIKTAFKEGQRDSKKMQFKAARIKRGDDHGHAEDIMEMAE